MKRIRTIRQLACFIAAATVLSLHGCAMGTVVKPAAKQDTETGFRTIGRAGMELRNINGTVKVVGVTEASAAEAAGVKAGDIIKSYDGRPATKMGPLIEYISANPNRLVTLEVMRTGQAMTLDVTPKAVSVAEGYDAYNKVFMLVKDGEKVTLAILVGNMTNLAVADAETLKNWGEGNRPVIYSRTEGYFLRSLATYDNFRIVDRAKIDQITREMTVQLSGVVQDEMRIKMGEMLGVTHIFQVDTIRSIEQGKVKDATITRLIEVQTGRVLATDSETRTIN